jgi:hypothetical protein
MHDINKLKQLRDDLRLNIAATEALSHLNQVEEYILVQAKQELLKVEGIIDVFEQFNN